MKKNSETLPSEYRNQKITSVKISDIIITDRIRQEIDDLTPLRESIANDGLLQPILLDADYRLIAGFRRLEAVKYLGWKKINAIILPVHSQVDRVRLEIDENQQRKNFTLLEIERGEKILHRLMHPSLWTKFWEWLLEFFRSFKRRMKSWNEKRKHDQKN